MCSGNCSAITIEEIERRAARVLTLTPSKELIYNKTKRRLSLLFSSYLFGSHITLHSPLLSTSLIPCSLRYSCPSFSSSYVIRLSSFLSSPHQIFSSMLFFSSFLSLSHLSFSACFPSFHFPVFISSLSPIFFFLSHLLIF